MGNGEEKSLKLLLLPESRNHIVGHALYLILKMILFLR